MADGRRFISMRLKFVAVLGVTGVAVLVGALLLIPLARNLICRAHMEPERVDRRLNGYIRSFAEYVADEHVRSDDAAAVVKWTRLHRTVYLSVLSGSDEYFGAAEGELWEDGSRPDMEVFFDELLPDGNGSFGENGITVDEDGTVYVVRFADGLASVAVVDYSVSTLSDAIVIAGVCVSFFIFLVIVLAYYHSQTRAIVALSEEVETVSGGALDSAIIADRNDEIGRLAGDVDTMRNTILRRMEEREEAWQANADLLTSMTHDIRTPLTTLLGYMELLGGESEDMTDEQRNYLRLCMAKAEQIKGLSDKLFLYFWAYNRRESDGAGDVLEASLLFEQLIGEYIPTMEAVGLTIETDLGAIESTDTVCVQPDALRRVTDNLFDNLKKYADPQKPIVISATREDGYICLSFVNTIGPRREHTTSTRIGLRTCSNMMVSMNGRFTSDTRGKLFEARLHFPLN